MGRKGEKVWRGFILGKFLIKLGDFLFKSCGHTAATNTNRPNQLQVNIHLNNRRIVEKEEKKFKTIFVFGGPGAVATPTVSRTYP